MNRNADFDGFLSGLLTDDGPTDVAPGVVDEALAKAARVGQRRPLIGSLDRRAWPSPLTAPGGTVRFAAVLAVLALLVIALVASLLFAGNDRGPDPLAVSPTRPPTASIPNPTLGATPGPTSASTPNPASGAPAGPCAPMVQFLRPYVNIAAATALPEAGPTRTIGRGDILATGSDPSGEVRIRRFEIATGIPQEIDSASGADRIFPSAQITAHGMSRIVPSPDSRALAIEQGDLREAGCGDPIVLLADGGRIRPFPSNAFELVSDPVWAPDGSALYAVRRPTIDENGQPFYNAELGMILKGRGTVLRWDTRTGVVTELPPDCGTCERLAVAPDGVTLAADGGPTDDPLDTSARLLYLYEPDTGWRIVTTGYGLIGFGDAESILLHPSGAGSRISFDGATIDEWDAPCCHGTGFGGPLSPDRTTMAGVTLSNDFLSWNVTLLDIRDGSTRGIWNTRDVRGCEGFAEGSPGRADCEAQGLGPVGPNAVSGYARVVAWASDASAVLLLDQNGDNVDSRLFVVPVDGSGPSGFATFDAPDLFFLGFPNLGPGVAWLPS